eukprot:995700-Amorphochlora_amoeboformis.AAC.1
MRAIASGVKCVVKATVVPPTFASAEPSAVLIDPKPEKFNITITTIERKSLTYRRSHQATPRCVGRPLIPCRPA